MFKTAVKKLESYMDKKYPEFRSKFYINRRNKLLHIGMDSAIFDKVIADYIFGIVNGF